MSKIQSNMLEELNSDPEIMLMFKSSLMTLDTVAHDYFGLR